MNAEDFLNTMKGDSFVSHSHMHILAEKNEGAELADSNYRPYTHQETGTSLSLWTKGGFSELGQNQEARGRHRETLDFCWEKTKCDSP